MSGKLFIIGHKIEQENSAKSIDKDADTPTLNAVNGINAAGLHNQLSSANKMLRKINKATFVDEQTYFYNDTPARLLRFNLPLEAIINEVKTRDYVSTFEGGDNKLVRVHHEYSNAICSTFGDNMSSVENILTILEKQSSEKQSSKNQSSKNQ